MHSSNENRPENSKSKSRLTWLSNLNPLTNISKNEKRKTRIICTLGPATETTQSITALRQAGMDIARLNFSHGDHEYHSKLIHAVRASEAEWRGSRVAIALDTKGPEKRLGDLQDPEGYSVKVDAQVILTTDPQYKSSGNPSTHGVFIDFPSIGESLTAGQSIFVDDGSLTLFIERITKSEKNHWQVHTKAKNAQKILGRKGVNMPESPMTQPPVSEKDKNDLQFAVQNNLDIILVSFTRNAADIHAIRQALGPQGTHIQVIAKIENKQGIHNFDEIVAAADGILVERGDLGIEIPVEKTCLAQKMMIAKCNMVGKPVICATQMLESMTVNPRPTRAESTDVANAVLDGTDCVMLSAESAVGKYPPETVQMMHRICLEAESAIPYASMYEDLCNLMNPLEDVCEIVAMAAVSASFQKSVSAIIVLTSTGATARLVAKYRPPVPILAITREHHVARQLNLFRGCFALFYPNNQRTDEWKNNVEERFNWAIEEGKKNCFFKSGDSAIIVQGSKGGRGNTNSLKVISIL